MFEAGEPVVLTLYSQSQAQPEAHKPKTRAKRKRADSLSRSASPDTEDTPPVDRSSMARRRRNAEVTAADQQPPDIVDIEPEGDLTIIFESENTGFKIDSKAVKRSSPVLYQQCLAVRRAGRSAWTFQGVPAHMQEATRVVLNVIHGNTNPVAEPMDCYLLHDIIWFMKEYEMKDGMLPSLRQWFFAMKQMAEKCDARWQLYGLWIAHELGLKHEFDKLQIWAVFNLVPYGESGIGDPRGIWAKRAADLVASPLFDVEVKGETPCFGLRWFGDRSQVRRCTYTRLRSDSSTAVRSH